MGKTSHAFMTGLFLVALITATVAAVFWIGHLERERNIYYVTSTMSVSGLNPESTVFFRGIPVGKVLTINFDPQQHNNILIKIEVDKNVTLTKGVYATLHLKGVTGLNQLELEDDNSLPAPLPIGDTTIRIPLRPSITDKLFASGENLIGKADHLMVRLSSILNAENEKNIGTILSNLNTLTSKLNSLQKSVDTALIGIPKLSKDASKTLGNFDTLSSDSRKTLAHVNEVARELRSLSKEVKKLSAKAGEFADSGKNAGQILAETTLPKANALIADLQSTSQQIKRIATVLETNPQSLFLGKQQIPGPGEPGYEEDQ